MIGPSNGPAPTCLPRGAWRRQVCPAWTTASLTSFRPARGLGVGADTGGVGSEGAGGLVLQAPIWIHGISDRWPSRTEVPSNHRTSTNSRGLMGHVSPTVIRVRRSLRNDLINAGGGLCHPQNRATPQSTVRASRRTEIGKLKEPLDQKRE